MRDTLHVHEASHTYLVCRCKEPLVSIRCRAIRKFSKNFTWCEALSEMMASVCFARWCPMIMSGTYIPKLWTWTQLLHYMSSSFWERPTLSVVPYTIRLYTILGIYRNICVLSMVRPEECGCSWNKHLSESESSREKFHLVMWPLDTLNYFCRCFAHVIWIYPHWSLFSCVKFCTVQIILKLFCCKLKLLSKKFSQKSI